MTDGFKPMLSGKATRLALLKFPLLCSPKLDGIRAYVRGGVLLSRNAKPIRNAALQAYYSRPEFEGLDGELITGSPTAPLCFNATTSVVSGAAAPADCTRFYVFDDFTTPAQPFDARLGCVHTRVARLPGATNVVPHTEVRTLTELADLEAHYLTQGYEGAMLRSPVAPYKYGRSTEAQGWLLKLKRFEDAEARVLAVIARLHNANAATVDALGRTSRSSHQSNKHATGTMGALRVVGLNSTFKGVEFSIGMGRGLDDAMRAHIWAEKDLWPGRVITYRYFPIGCKTAPRFPGLVGERLDWDEQPAACA